MSENNDIQIVEYYLNNFDVYTQSKPYPRSDTYGRDGWFYMNTEPITGDTQADQVCNINIYNELSAKVQDEQDISNYLQVENIDCLALKLIAAECIWAQNTRPRTLIRVASHGRTHSDLGYGIPRPC